MSEERLKARQFFYKYLNPVFSNPYILLLPALVLSLVFTFVPVGFILVNSFFRWNTMTGERRFVLFGNFIRIFTDPEFTQALINTIIYMFATVAVGLSLSVLIALFLNKKTWTHQAVQSIVFTPHIVSAVSISILWMWIMDPQFGFLNFVIGFFGIKPLRWMSSADTSLLSVIIVAIWKMLGYNVTIAVAGLKGIPEYIYEAAMLDRANKFTRFFKITLPMLSPTLVFMLVTTCISSFCPFDIVYLMTKGGPRNSSNVITHWIYQTGFLRYRTGDAMAAAIIMLVMVTSISLFNFKVLNKHAYYQ
jgi:sn-glycerol 3-phosphate transport system permease protein